MSATDTKQAAATDPCGLDVRTLCRAAAAFASGCHQHAAFCTQATQRQGLQGLQTERVELATSKARGT